MREPCPFCRGKGRRAYRTGPTFGPCDEVLGEDAVSLVCDECSGTGDLETMKLVRAFRLGQTHEHLCVLATLTGGKAPRFPSAETIRSAVLSDERRQRYEDSWREGEAA